MLVYATLMSISAHDRCYVRKEFIYTLPRVAYVHYYVECCRRAAHAAADAPMFAERAL